MMVVMVFMSRFWSSALVRVVLRLAKVIKVVLGVAHTHEIG